MATVKKCDICKIGKEIERSTEPACCRKIRKIERKE